MILIHVSGFIEGNLVVEVSFGQSAGHVCRAFLILAANERVAGLFRFSHGFADQLIQLSLLKRLLSKLCVISHGQLVDVVQEGLPGIRSVRRGGVLRFGPEISGFLVVLCHKAVVYTVGLYDGGTEFITVECLIRGFGLQGFPKGVKRGPLHERVPVDRSHVCRRCPYISRGRVVLCQRHRGQQNQYD